MDEVVAALVTGIYALQEERVDPERQYLGLSGIGNPCQRALWLSHRHAYRKQHTGRMLRLFETGNREEDRIITELLAKGYTVLARNPSTRRQWSVSDCGGHVKGHFDGLIKLDGRWCLLEIKTSNTSGFKAIIKHGLAKTKPLHVAQMQVYMYYSRLYWSEWGMDGDPPDGACYICECKETDGLLALWVPYDESSALALVQTAQDVVAREEPPPKIRLTSGYPCTVCDYFAICQQVEPVAVDCRTCMHSTADIVAGGWRCELWRQAVPTDCLAMACDDHVYIAPLLEERHGGVIAYDDAVLAAPVMWVEYQADNGDRVVNAAASSSRDGMTSRELAALDILRIDID